MLSVGKPFGKLLLLSIPFGLYAFLLRYQLPLSLTSFFHAYHPLTALIVLVLYYFSFKLHGTKGWIVGLSLTFILFALSLSYIWTSGFSNNGIIGGLLPYKDGRNYYVEGAKAISDGDLISKRGNQAAGRPLFPGFLSVFLSITGHNLQSALAVIVGLTAFCIYLSARQLLSYWAPLAASVYMMLFYFYVQPLIGTTLSEFAGIILGVLGFILLLKSIEHRSEKQLIVALIVLTVGISARAGAFIVLPLLAIWSGFFYSEKERYSYRITFLSMVSILVSFLLVNVIYPRLVVESGGVTNGNFAYTLYGQVTGGNGWVYAIEHLGTTKPAKIYAAVWSFFLQHPLSVVIGSLKAYRDFIFPGINDIFGFHTYRGLTWLDTLSWGCAWILCIWGLVSTIRRIREPLPALLLVSFIGIFLSIPFLPPIDGGQRFYASTMALFFAMPVFAINEVFPSHADKREAFAEDKFMLINGGTLALILSMLIIPVIYKRVITPVDVQPPVCTADQVPFIVEVYKGAYIDIIPEGKGECGLAPMICLKDFDRFGSEKNIDVFYDFLLRKAYASNVPTRLLLGRDLLTRDGQYFIAPVNMLSPDSNGGLVSGCAIHTKVITQTIYEVQTTSDK
ncbi:MAG: hypothetical protein HZB50_05710 [Chloroflexi bacterium]|nr:hypothetical protein [Chloroflexota bacterium]